MSTVTPRAALPELAAAQAQKHVTHNEALIQLDALLNARILDRNLAAPPLTPANGDAWLVAANPTGAWTGQAGKIAFAVDGGWRFYTPFAGLTVFVADESVMLVYTAGGWVDFASVMAFQNVPLLGVNTTTDATNKFALKANAALFAALEAANGGTGDMRIVNNKSAAANTASFLFQDNFSGRAEFGLTGNDNFHMKVSADGAAWLNALTILSANGNVGIGLTNPSTKLDILDTSANAPQILVENTSTFNVRFGLNTSNVGFVGSSNVTPVQIQTNGIARAYFDVGGNVGIGTESPNTKLEIAGANMTLPPTSGSASTGELRVGVRGSSPVLDFGVDTAVTNASWIQAHQSTNYAINYNLLLNPNGGNVGIGTQNPTGMLDVNDDHFRVRISKTPATATAAGNQGDIAWDTNFLYVCVTANTWKRAALASW